MTQEIQQTYIVFYKQCNSKMHKFISQAMTQNAEAVRMYIDRHNGLDLIHRPKETNELLF